MRSLLDMGLKLPQDLSVVLYDGVPEDSPLSMLAVSSIEQPDPVLAGQCLADLMLGLNEGKPTRELQVLWQPTSMKAERSRPAKMTSEPVSPQERPSFSVDIADPCSRESQQLLADLSRTLERITGSNGANSFRLEDVQAEGGCFVVCRTAEGVAVACGALRPLEPGVAELKRMFAVLGSRGAGSAVLAFLEREAALLGYGQIWLETRRVNQRAIAFYERHGYRATANYGRYVGRPEAICMAKTLEMQEPGFSARNATGPAG